MSLDISLDLYPIKDLEPHFHRENDNKTSANQRNLMCALN